MVALGSSLRYTAMLMMTRNTIANSTDFENSLGGFSVSLAFFAHKRPSRPVDNS